jgi:hypothetical protein
LISAPGALSIIFAFATPCDDPPHTFCRALIENLSVDLSAVNASVALCPPVGHYNLQDLTAGLRMASILRRAGLLLALCSTPFAQSGRAADSNDYPTAARAEFVFACMATNGGNQEALQHCSCAIDVIASLLPYDNYEKAETVLRMRRSAGGYLGAEFRSALTNNIVRDLDEAQAEAEVRCF